MQKQHNMQTVIITLAFFLFSLAAHLPGPVARAGAIREARAKIDTLEQAIMLMDSVEAGLDSTFAKYEYKGEWYWDKKEQAARLREQAREEMEMLDGMVEALRD